MKSIIKKFEEQLKEESAENTVSAYVGDIKRFAEELNLTNKRGLSRVDEAMLEDYISAIKNRGAAYSTVARTVAALKKFFSFCVENLVVKKNPTENIKAPKQKRNLPNTMSFDEVERLLEAPDANTVKGKRDRAMLEVMYATGARVSELISLKVSDVSLKNEMAVLTTGRSHRLVPLGKAAIAALIDYIKVRSNIKNSSSDALFLNFYGGPLTRQGFWKIIKHYIKESGISDNVTAQTLRHSFALHLLKNGADAESVSEMLGYSDVSSTKIYLEVMNNKIKDVYKNAHPRA